MKFLKRLGITCWWGWFVVLVCITISTIVTNWFGVEFSLSRSKAITPPANTSPQSTFVWWEQSLYIICIAKGDVRIVRVPPVQLGSTTRPPDKNEFDMQTMWKPYSAASFSISNGWERTQEYRDSNSVTDSYSVFFFSQFHKRFLDIPNGATGSPTRKLILWMMDTSLVGLLIVTWPLTLTLALFLYGQKLQDWYCARKARKSWQCTKCGYELSRIPLDLPCPECGTLRPKRK